MGLAPHYAVPLAGRPPITPLTLRKWEKPADQESFASAVGKRTGKKFKERGLRKAEERESAETELPRHRLRTQPTDGENYTFRPISEGRGARPHPAQYRSGLPRGVSERQFALMGRPKALPDRFSIGTNMNAEPGSQLSLFPHLPANVVLQRHEEAQPARSGVSEEMPGQLMLGFDPDKERIAIDQMRRVKNRDEYGLNLRPPPMSGRKRAFQRWSSDT